MTGAAKQSTPTRVAEVLSRYGRCLELVPIDPNFENISVGLYVKGSVCTVWTFSRKSGAQERVEQVRGQLVALGGMEPVEETHNQARFPCGQIHERPVKFLLSQAVGKSPDYAPPTGEMSIKDLRSPLTLVVTGGESDGRWVYSVAGQGEAPNPGARLRMVVAGFLRYGEMEKVGDRDVVVSLRRTARRPHAPADALLAQHLQRRRHDGGRGPSRPDDHRHPRLHPADVGQNGRLQERNPEMSLTFTIETEQESDGRWIAEVMEIPGALVYGTTTQDAVAKVQALALRILADRIEHGEISPELVDLSFRAA